MSTDKRRKGNEYKRERDFKKLMIFKTKKRKMKRKKKKRNRSYIYSFRWYFVAGPRYYESEFCKLEIIWKWCMYIDAHFLKIYTNAKCASWKVRFLGVATTDTTRGDERQKKKMRENQEWERCRNHSREVPRRLSPICSFHLVKNIYIYIYILYTRL